MDDKDVGGRPPHFATAEELDKKIDEYFAPSATGINSTITITGLAYHLGFESRQSFYDYEKREGFSYIIKRARLYIESMYELRLQGDKPTGSIFALKNMGWTDKQEIEQRTEHSGSLTIDYTKLSDAALAEIAKLDRPKESQD